MSGEFRVLALDGGGIKGAYTASVLAELERMSGKRLADYFDLITGTSTGGIIALALGLGIPMDCIRDLYVKKGPEIFPPRPLRGLRWLFSPKYNNVVLKEVLAEVFGDRLLKESKVRLVIPAFNAQRGNVQLFKTAHDPRYKQDYLLPATTVALSTASAPTYFAAHTAPNGACYVDGGVWANCPARVGLLEAMAIFNRPREEIQVLSIGTTDEPYWIRPKQRNGGIAAWAKDTPNMLLKAQVRATIGECELLLRERFLRIDELVPDGRFALDGARNVDDLRALGEDAARRTEAKVAAQFLYAPAAPFAAVTNAA